MSRVVRSDVGRVVVGTCQRVSGWWKGVIVLNLLSWLYCGKYRKEIRFSGLQAEHSD